MNEVIAVSIEAAPKKAFATAVDWPGWSRSGKTEGLAIEALGGHAARYAAVARLAGEKADPLESPTFEVVERIAGGAGTEFGVPGNVTDHDRRRVRAAEAARLVAIVEAAWRTFDKVAAAAPSELRKGPRGGGRDTARIVDHVVGSEQSYANSMGIKVRPFDSSDRRARDSMRALILDVLRQPSDGSPIADRKWTTRYAAHRIAWHVLDHVWEIEDRSEPAG